MTVMQRETDPAPRKVRASRTRWWIVWTLFFSTVTNYISRQTFSVLAPLITAQYHLTHTDLARILGVFQISYAITWPGRSLQESRSLPSAGIRAQRYAAGTQ